MHALIIEDEAIIAMAIEDVLRDAGFTSIAFATSLDAAVSEAQIRCPDLITADVRLAPGCGIDAVETICSERPIPVIFITGSPLEVVERCPDHIIVTKPFVPNDVTRAVQLARSGLP
jgi:CheY-like chemotaxis protein